MKNLNIDELNEKAKNELKNSNQGELQNISYFARLAKKIHKWNFELDKKIYKLKHKQKSKDSDIMFHMWILFGIFCGILISNKILYKIY